MKYKLRSHSWFDIRKYLKEFLSDRRVIELNPIIWQIILNNFILNLRPSKTAEAYKKIWLKKENMSPEILDKIIKDCKDKPLKKINLFIALGCVIKGDTYHFEVISDAVGQSLLDISSSNSKTIIKPIAIAEALKYGI